MKRRSNRGWRILTSVVNVFLLVLVVVGVARELRASALTREFRTEFTSAAPSDLEALNRRVAERMHRLHNEGQVAEPQRFPLHTWADYLLKGGYSCGEATAALASILDKSGRGFRVLQVNVQPVVGASHIMIEARADDGRWILLDPLFGRAFPHPTTGQLMTLEEVRRLPDAEYAQLPEDYRVRWSLRGAHRRTNWERLPGVRKTLALLMSEENVSALSVRAWTVEPGYELAFAAGCTLLTMHLLRRRREQERALAESLPERHEAAPSSSGAH